MPESNDQIKGAERCSLCDGGIRFHSGKWWHDDVWCGDESLRHPPAPRTDPTHTCLREGGRNKTIGVGVCIKCRRGGLSLLPGHVCTECRAGRP